MQIRNLLSESWSTDDRAVSPVIGVILMVAVTVILAAVIGTFVLGVGSQTQATTPSAQFTTDYDQNPSTESVTGGGDCDSSSVDGELTITHDGGDNIEAERLTITGSAASGGTVDWATCSDVGANSDVKSGKQAEVKAAADDKVRLVWTDKSGSSSATLREWEGPEA